MRWWRGLAGRAGRSAGRDGGGRAPSQRTTGDPPSANGASSLHLFWHLDGHFAAAEVTLEVLGPPAVDRLYFWALQAAFSDGRRELGAAHLGLQWHPSYPGSTAVNWGGYHRTGGELDGSVSPLPSALGNPNTRDLPWRPTTPYRLRIERGDTPGAWRGLVIDPATGPVEVRRLYGGGSHLCSLMTWSEVFARCEHPSVTVRWSDPVAFADDGRAHRPATVTVNYQAHDDGGCANTDAFADATGLCQRTATTRRTPGGSTLAVPRSSGAGDHR